MRNMVKETKSTKKFTSNNLENYEEFIAGYKQYKRDKASLHIKAAEAGIHGT